VDCPDPGKAERPRDSAGALTLTAADPYGLERFVLAQAPVYEQVRRELEEGHKRSHWMWFVFPQLAGLGSSATAVHYAISSAEEAQAYSLHSVLGPRLTECTDLVEHVSGRSIAQIFGYPDHLKFHSCMTLFKHAGADPAPFERALQKYFGGSADPRTLQLLAAKRG
jgi:uncharacterized protein (DUF1810 family)